MVLLDEDTGDVREDVSIPDEAWLSDVADRIKKVFNADEYETYVGVMTFITLTQAYETREGA